MIIDMKKSGENAISIILIHWMNQRYNFWSQTRDIEKALKDNVLKMYSGGKDE